MKKEKIHQGTDRPLSTDIPEKGWIKGKNHSDAVLFMNYVLYAGIATLVDLGVLYALTEYAGVWYLFSAVISYCAGMVTNFTLNKYLNFRNKSRKIVQQFGIFAIVAVVGLGLNQLILAVLVEVFKLWYMYAKLISIAIVMFWSFFGHKKLTFGILK
jgi:putative flippase GtrA